LQLEVALYRDQKPRSRPSPLFFDNRFGQISTAKLFPGPVASTGEHLVVRVKAHDPVHPTWLAISAQFLIDAMPFTDPRPGLIYTNISDVPTFITFLSPAPYDDPHFGGIHMLSFRRVM
jgi:hypothetical protein